MVEQVPEFPQTEMVERVPEFPLTEMVERAPEFPQTELVERVPEFLTHCGIREAVNKVILALFISLFLSIASFLLPDKSTKTIQHTQSQSAPL